MDLLTLTCLMVDARHILMENQWFSGPVHLGCATPSYVDVFLCLPGFIIQLHVFLLVMGAFGGIFGNKKGEHEQQSLSVTMDTVLIGQTPCELGGCWLCCLRHGGRISNDLISELNIVLKYVSENI